MTSKSIDTLVEDIYALFDGVGNELNPYRVKDFGQALGNKIATRLTEERGTPNLRLSNLGTVCERQLWYSINLSELAEPLPPQARIKFLFGDILEELLLFLAREAGHDVQDEQKEVSLYGVKGHKDATIDGITVDCKSASSRSFDKFKSGLTPENDSFGYLTQLDAYCHADDSQLGAFLAIDKTLGHLCLDKHERTDKDYSDVVRRKKEVIASSTPPPRGFAPEPDGKSGNMKLGVNCSYCAFKTKCWPGLRTFIYSNGPRYLTRVERVPDVPEV